MFNDMAMVEDRIKVRECPRGGEDLGSPLVGDFKGKHCEKSCMTESALNYHMESLYSTSGKDFKCKNCEKSFKHKMFLKRQIKLYEEKIIYFLPL